MTVFAKNGNDEAYVVGIDLGGTHLRMGAIAQDDQVLRATVCGSRELLTMERPLEGLLQMVEEFIGQANGLLLGICIGFPGTVSKDKTRVASCPNLPVFDGVDISAAFRARFGVPTVVEHEVLLLLSNDMKKFDLFDRDCVMAVYLGTGLGNALYIHGRILEGKNGTAGELGHIPVVGSATPCPCGNVGCMELLASGKRLEQIRAENFGGTCTFEQLFAQHGGHPVIVNYLDCIACGVATEINILDPDVILLGGGVLESSIFPYDELLARIHSHVRKPYPAQNLCFIRVPQDAHQGVRGAGIYFRNRFNKDF